MDVEKTRRLFFRFGNSTAFRKILSDAEIAQRTLFRIPDDPHSLPQSLENVNFLNTFRPAHMKKRN